MKKLITLIVAAIAVGALAYFGFNLIKKSGSSVDSELIEFAIKDVEKIDRVVITDNFGRVMDLRKPANSDVWTDKDGGCIQQEGIYYILDACKKIEFKGYLNENSIETKKNIMMAQHIKVEYYLNGKWHKTWYIGPASKDHLGQVMLLESDELGKSDRPVIMAIKGMYGIIEPRFYADPLKWKCTQIFDYEARDIKKVDVRFPLEPSRSFSVESLGNNRYSVKQQDIPLPQVDTQFVMLYLNKFKKIHYETANYLLDNNQIDSLKRTSPFCTLDIRLKNGKNTKMKMYRIHAPEVQLNEFGIQVTHDVERFWAELPGGEIVKCQYFVFDPLILGHIYFPMDMSKVDMNDYKVLSPEKYHDLR
jgi:hypothetical protein